MANQPELTGNSESGSSGKPKSAKAGGKRAAGKTKAAANGQKARSVTLAELFQNGLKDIYYAEKKILDALPELEEAAENRDLRMVLARHRRQTETQVERLLRIFEIIGTQPGGKPCPAIDALIEEGSALISQYERSPARDAGLLAAAQAVEHYEIARYGALREWARELNLREAVRLIQDTLREEDDADRFLSDLAEHYLNEEARRSSSDAMSLSQRH
jgi:ferritin-like metal-binding protein YciE